MRLHRLLLAGAVIAAVPTASRAQDANFLMPIEEIEDILKTGDFDIIDIKPSLGLPGERTQRATVQAGGRVLQIKYAPSLEGADEFNNRPRYELGAYVVQMLFLGPPEYVVPPTVVRAFPIDVVEATLDKVPGDNLPPPERTFDEWPMTLVALQYWMFNVEVPDELRDRDRLEEDEGYARHLGNFNLLTYLIRHSDSNEGNFLRSADPSNLRVFSVDNGVAFSNEESDRGTYWRDLRLDRYPASSIERLRSYSLEDLYRRLGVLVQFEIRGGNFVEVEPTENLDQGRGVRHDDVRIQLGLTDSEIRNIHRRLTRLLERVDDGRYELIP